MLKISQIVVATALMLAVLVLIIPNDTADAASVTLAMPQGEAYVPGRLMVKLKQSEFAAEGLILPEGVNVVGEIAAVGVQIVETDPAQMGDVYAQLRAHPAVEAVELDYVTWTAGMPDDPYLVSGTQWAPIKIQAPDAWAHATGQDIIIAIVDSGIDPNHPDLQGQLLPGFNFVDFSTNASDGCGHGTHVAGIAAAAANNGIGIAGIAPNARLMPVKVMGDNCGGSYSKTINGIIWATNQGAQVIVITSGGTSYSSTMESAVQYARDRGAIVIAAAGNSNTDAPFYPASHANAFSVSGTTDNDNRYSNSNYGSQIDVAAPAYSIYSTYVNSGNSTYAYMSGTSMAAPHVAGVAALIWAKNPQFSVAQVEEAVRASADDLGEPGWDMYFGAGRVNALNAFDPSQPAEPTATPTEIPPTATPTEIPPTATPTEIPPTATPTEVPPTATPTEVPPTATPTEVPPTATPTEVPPTAVPTEEPAPPTATPTEIPPTATPTEVPPTATPTEIPPTATPTEIPPTATPTEIPPTQVPPTATPQTISAREMYVSMVDVTIEKRSTASRATALFTIVDANGVGVNEASVKVAWNGAYGGADSCTTNSQGRCSVQTSYFQWQSGNVLLSVEQITHSELTYEAAADLEPSPIVVSLPQSLRLPLAASSDNGLVTLFWPATSQAAQNGFMVYRSENEDLETATRLTERPLSADDGSNVFAFQDSGVDEGHTYHYWLVSVQDGEEWGELASVDVRVDIILQSALYLPAIAK